METLQGWDVAVFRLINGGLHRDWLDPLFWLLSVSGLGWSQAVVILGLALWKPTRRFALPLGLSTALAGILLCDGIKALVHRDRPSLMSYAFAQEAFEPGGHASMQSFPSGHASSSFGFALMVLFLTWKGEHRWLGWLAVGWACLVGFSRVYRGAHWPTDVLAGVCCGLLGLGLTVTILDWWNAMPTEDAPTES